MISLEPKQPFKFTSIQIDVSVYFILLKSFSLICCSVDLFHGKDKIHLLNLLMNTYIMSCFVHLKLQNGNMGMTSD